MYDMSRKEIDDKVYAMKKELSRIYDIPILKVNKAMPHGAISEIIDYANSTQEALDEIYNQLEETFMYLKHMKLTHPDEDYSYGYEENPYE